MENELLDKFGIKKTVLLAVVLVACGGGGAGSTPEATVQNFINSLKNNDMNGFVKCLDPDTQEMMNEALDQMKSFGLNLSIKDRDTHP